MPLAWLGDIASLEQRISCLEEKGFQSSLNDNITPVAKPTDISQTAPHGEKPSQVVPYLSTVDHHNEAYLPRSSPAIGLLATFARAEDGNPAHLRETERSKTYENPADTEGMLDRSKEDALFKIYRDKVHCRYPFLRLDEVQDATKRPAGQWMDYFTNMIFSIGRLLENPNQFEGSQHSHQAFHRIAVTRYLSHVFAQSDRLLHIQAYLLLAMHAIYMPSTERIISIASATMRYCVMAQLHLADTEPEPIDAATQSHVQMRRRVFWSAYALDRAVGTAFDLPFSIPDYQITVKLYANTGDDELERGSEAYPKMSQNRPHITSVSSALHVVYCRQIQSEILNTTLHRDFNKQFDRLSHWRLRILRKLDHWKSLCHRYSDPRSKTSTSNEWLNMIYNYSLAMLYQPTKMTVVGPAGDWTIKSCVQACLLFRKFQRETPMTELWLGLIVQFKCGVALLYCFFATPPHLRSAAYGLPDTSEAVRACSIILSILAERWPQARCVRDSFDILAREIPLFEITPTAEAASLPRKMRQESAEILLGLLGELETIIVHRNTLRMIKEMVVEDFPRPIPGPSGAIEVAIATVNETHVVDGESPSWRISVTGDIFQPVTPHFFQQDTSTFEPDEFDYMAIGFPGEFDPQISF